MSSLTVYGMEALASAISTISNKMPNKREKLWMDVYVASIQSGQGPLVAKTTADAALLEFDTKFR